MIAEYAMDKCHLIEVIMSCIWHMFVPEHEKDDDDDDDDDDEENENILKTHPLACKCCPKSRQCVAGPS